MKSITNKDVEIMNWNKDEFQNYFIDKDKKLNRKRFSSFSNLSEIYDLYNMDYLRQTTYKVIKISSKIVCIAKFIQKNDRSKVEFFSTHVDFRECESTFKNMLNIS